MYLRIFAAATFAVLAGTSTAYAGGKIASDPVAMSSNDTQRCVVMNTSSKTLGEVTVSMVKANALAPEATYSCPTLAPFEQCGFQNSAPSGGNRFCLVTVDGSKKALRGTFCNDNIDVCSTLR